ncbi:unnamed protein product [Arctogadus glacialis]
MPGLRLRTLVPDQLLMRTHSRRAPSVEPRSPRRRQWSPGPHGAVSGAPVLTAPSVEPRSSRPLMRLDYGSSAATQPATGAKREVNAAPTRALRPGPSSTPRRSGGPSVRGPLVPPHNSTIRSDGGLDSAARPRSASSSSLRRKTLPVSLPPSLSDLHRSPPDLITGHRVTVRALPRGGSQETQTDHPQHNTGLTMVLCDEALFKDSLVSSLLQSAMTLARCIIPGRRFARRGAGRTSAAVLHTGTQDGRVGRPEDSRTREQITADQQPVGVQGDGALSGCQASFWGGKRPCVRKNTTVTASVRPRRRGERTHAENASDEVSSERLKSSSPARLSSEQRQQEERDEAS